ncbi:hypothetical protein LG201_13860 [Methylobacillus gramineus]|uniref:hypothetical protein n=1 Tax=Methylobacillus gramineus TaxID=755169 RepID=UPI001CFF6966|nr:hypothetical protein [Methylobacillus gramineus]MCB5186296.1 hypothetical protein [Methylobacillus gramineus]
MATTDRRAKLQQKIADLQSKLEALEAPATLDSKSEGIPELIEKLNEVIKLHKVAAPEVIEVLLKAKRTGLTLVKKS